MLSKLAQRNLAFYFSAMIALHGYVLWQARQSIMEGRPDFSIFYAAGKILRDGNRKRLYDDALQGSVQRTFSPRAFENRGVLPYNHPPFEALLFVPLAHVSYRAAYAIWFLTNLVFLFFSLCLLRSNLSRLGKTPLHLWVLGCLGFFPIFMALIQGQDSILLLFLYCLAFRGLRRNRESSAGSWLGLGLYKYHLVVPFILPLFRRRKLIAGFMQVALILALISLVMIGWHGLLRYPSYVWSTEDRSKYAWNYLPGITANLRGLSSAVVPITHPQLNMILVVLSSAIVLGLMIHAGREAHDSNSESGQALIALYLIGTVLLSYHIFVHDLSLLFLADALILDILLAQPPIPNWTRATLYVSIGVLSCSPLYILLTLRYRKLQVVACVLLIVFTTLLSLIRSSPMEVDGTASPQA